MISNDVVKADLVASLKANSTLTDSLVRQDGEGGVESVKESQYAGTTFTYPAVRVRINRQIPITDRGPCDHARLSFSIRILTEGASSKDADEIAGVVNNHFHGNEGGGKFFQGTGWNTNLRSSGLDAAVRTGEKAWMSVANFEGVVYPS
ncbi:MAG: hypothetical protein GTN64_08085 [Candidatus Latescibacteria bacterium]|nr:hypothetical protein [Candidatus Latescibacterota bacterium]NIO78561.1 hypothetical protein [Candidatus Latescibacterota bacterium]